MSATPIFFPVLSFTGLKKPCWWEGGNGRGREGVREGRSRLTGKAGLSADSPPAPAPDFFELQCKVFYTPGSRAHTEMLGWEQCRVEGGRGEAGGLVGSPCLQPSMSPEITCCFGRIWLRLSLGSPAGTTCWLVRTLFTTAGLREASCSHACPPSAPCPAFPHGAAQAPRPLPLDPAGRAGRIPAP